MAATFAVIDVVDSEGRVSPMRMRVSAATMPTGYDAFIAGVIGATFGTGLLSLGGVKRAYLEIESGSAAAAPAADVDIRDNWQTRWSSAYPRPFRLGIPARNPDPALIATGGVVIGNLTVTEWAAFISSLTGTIKVLDPTNGDVTTGILSGIAGVRGRKRPRVGSTR